MSRHAVTARTLLVTALFCAGPVVAQTASPLDTAQAVGLLRESVAALEASEMMRHDRAFQEHLALLFRLWGEEWSPPPPLAAGPSVEEVTDSLTRLGEVERAVELALEQEGHARRRALVPILDWMVEHGQADRALAFSDSIGESRSGIMAVLSASRPRPTPWRVRVDRIGEFLREDSRDTARLEDNWNLVVGFVARRDFDAARELAQTRIGPRRPLFNLLSVAAERRLPVADSLLLDTYERVRRLPDASTRFLQLGWLKNLCGERVLRTCDHLDLPEDPFRRMPGSVSGRLQNAAAEGDWAKASAIGDTLRDLVPTERYALVLAEALGKAAPRRGYDSLSATLLPWLDTVASRMRGPTADSLDARLAGLWAVLDPERARRAVGRIDSDALRTDALTNLAQASHPTNLRVAFEALRQGGSAGQGIRLPSMYVDFLLWRDTTRAEQVYGMLANGAERMRARLGWAEVVRGTGRWAEARALAFEALEEWDPVAQPRPLSFGLLGVFARLGVYDELIAWARARETADARASALAAIVGSVGRYRWYRPSRGIY